MNSRLRLLWRNSVFTVKLSMLTGAGVDDCRNTLSVGAPDSLAAFSAMPSASPYSNTMAAFSSSMPLTTQPSSVSAGSTLSMSADRVFVLRCPITYNVCTARVKAT